MRKNLYKILRLATRLILWKYRPKVIVVTGSVGKTSTKEAIFAVLSSQFYVRRSLGNYNNEIGVPLTVLGSKTGGKNIVRWLWIFIKMACLFVLPLSYPEILVLEVGADRPGDLKYLMSFIHPHVSVVTAVGQSHLEFFKQVEKIAQEKSEVVATLRSNGFSVLNFDDELVQSMSARNKGTNIFYGLDPDADVAATDLAYREDGLLFKLHFRGNVVPVFLPGFLGQTGIYAALAASSVGIALKMNLVDIGTALKVFQSPPGRMRLIAGIRHSIIIDDTYNSAPNSVAAALDVLSRDYFTNSRKIAVLGEMAELGKYTEAGHREVGRVVAKIKPNILVVVGSKSKFLADEAIKRGFDEQSVLEFNDSMEARIPIQEMLQEKDVVLVKGSQSARMERIVKEIMAEPERAKELLCRQSKDWLNRT